MMSRGLLILVTLALVSCAHPPAPPQQPVATPTTTGILPPGVPTEGTRPPADGLPPAAEPQSAPPQARPIPGRIVPVGASPEGVVVDAKTRLVAVAKRDPNELILLNADTGDVVSRIGVPGFARHLQLAASGGPILVPVESANALIRVELPSGQAEPLIFTGTVPHDAAQAANGPFSSQTSSAAPLPPCGDRRSSRSSQTACNLRAWHRSATSWACSTSARTI